MGRDVYNFIKNKWAVLLADEHLDVYLRKHDFPASQLDWNRIQHFSPNEHWGNLNYVSGLLVLIIDQFRDYCEIPFYLTPVGEGASYCTKGHFRHSWHYVLPKRHPFALATDFFPQPITKDIYIDIAVIASLKGFRGVGVYPDTKDEAIGRGAHLIHLDLRFSKTVYWARIDGKYIYYHSSSEFSDGLEELR